MAKYSNTVEYNISTKLDASGLTKLQAQIKQLETSMQKMSNKELIDDEKISAAKTQLEGLNSALTKSFNPSLGILDLSKFRLELENSGVSAKGLQSAFSMMGAEGKAALNGLTTQIANFNGGMKRTSSTVDKVFTTFSNTFRWGLISSFFSNFMNSVHQSVDYVKELDDSLTQIMLVTDYNRDSMNQFAKSANEAAKAVSMTTTGMTNASLIFAQQGYNLNQSQELATLSAKLANASQQDTATTSDQITAYMNAYGLQNSMEELTQQMDNWALIANVSAADVGELAQASQRAASMANAVGVSGEQLAAQIATIESVTREAPEQIGNGLKTLYARFSDIEAGGEDEEGFTLGKITSQLNAIGVQILDQFGNIRDVGDIMEDLMVIWDDLDQTSKVAASQALAGKYQVNRFMALMDNSGMYQEYKGATGSAATGTLDQMNEEYANSIAGRSAKLQASLEGLFSTIFNTDDIYPWIEAAQSAVDLLQQFFDALGGGKVVLLGITSLLTQAFSQNMARSINDMVANYNLGKIRERNINTVQDTLTAAGIDQTQGVGAYIRSTAGQSKLGALNEAQYDNYMSNVQQWADTSTKLATAEENLIDNINTINLVYGKLTNNKNAAVLSNGELDTSLAAMTRQGLSSSQINNSIKEMDFSDVADKAKNAAIVLRDLQSNFDQLYVTSDQLVKPIDDVSIALESLTATGGYSSNSVEKIKLELEELRVAVEEGGISSEDAKIKIQKYVNEMERLNTIASEMNGKTAEQILSGGGIGAQRAKTDYDLAQIQDKAIAEKALSDQGGIDFQQNIKGVLDMVSAVQQLTFAVTAFHNIGSIWKNEDLSQGEKIVQTIMNLTTVLFNTTSGMKNLYDGMKNASGLFSALKKSIIEQAEAIQKKKILEEQAAQAEKDHNIQQLQDAQQKIQAEVNEAEAAKVTADINVLKAETALQSAKANLEEAQASLSSIDADQAKINSIKLIAEAHLAAAQAAIAQAEAEGRVVDPRAEADLLGAKEDLVEVGIKQFELDKKAEIAKKAVADANEDVLQKEKELLNVKKEASAAEEKLIEKQNLLTEVTQELGQALSTVSSAFFMANNSMDLLHAIGKKLTSVVEKLGLSITGLGTKIAAVAPILIPLMALGGTAYGMFKDIENKKAENSKNYEEAKAQLEEIRSLTEQANNFQQQYESQKGTEQAFDGLADSAKEYAQSLKDLGEEDRAQQVESAILRAELQNTEESYQNLSNVISETQEKLEDSTYIDMMDKAYAAISNTGESVQFLAKQEQELKDKRAELNNLSKNDPYRTQLENEIKELEDFIAKNQEAYEAKEQLMASALDYNLNQASKTNGWEMGILNTPGDDDIRAATMDWQSLNSILEESVPGFAEITDENERLSLALAHTSDEAQRAAIQIQQMLNTSDVLSEGQKTGITRQLESAGFSAQEALQVIASLNIDEETSYNNIVPEIQDIIHRVNEDKESLSVVLQAKMDPEQVKETVKSQIATYEPKDEDVDKEDFDSLADTFYENKNQMGVEGTPFEDFSEDLFENATALEDVIEGILRYNDAIESLDENYDNWKDTLENTNELSTEHLQVVEELQETYSDFLGLSKNVSKRFASNAENLELMREAAEGNTEAFEDLEDAAAVDIYMQITGLEDLDAAQQKIEEINDILANSGIEEIPVGEVFNLDDFESVRSAIDSELQALGLDAEQAAQYVSDVWHLDIPADQFTVIDDDMNAAAASAESTATHVAGVVEGVTDTVLDNANYSVSTDIDTDTAEATDTVTFTNLTPQPIGPVPITSMMPVGNGNTGVGGGVHMEPFVAETYGVGYSTDPHTVEQLKQQTGFKEDVKAEKGGNGHVSLPSGSGAKGSRRPSSGLGRSSASRPSSNKGSGGKGGGGGGGGSKAKTIQSKEKKDHKKDYYEEVNGQLNKTEKILSKIEKEEDRLIGDKARANQNKQLKLLQKEIDLNNKKLGIQKQELSDVDKLIKDQDKLAEKTAKNAGITDFSIPDVILDADGIVSNYEQISKRIDDIHNSLINKYNEAAAAGNEELTKQLEKTISQFDKYGESLLKGAQRHNALKAEIEGTLGELENLDDAIEDIRIDAWKASTEAIDNLKELRESAAELEGFFSGYESDSPFRALIEDAYKLDNVYQISKKDAEDYYNEIISDKEKALKAATSEDEKKAIQTSINYFKSLRSNLSDNKLGNGLLGLAMDDLQQLQKWYDNPNAKDNPFGENTAALKEAYEEAYNRVHDMLLEQEKWVEDYRDHIIDAYNDIEDKQNRQIDKFDRIVDKLEQFSDMYALYYGDESYDMMRDVLQQQGNTLREQLNQQKTLYEYWSEQYVLAVQTGDEKLMNELEDKMNDAEDKMADLAKEAAKAFADSYENAVKASTQHIIQNTIGDKNFDRLDRNWEWDKDYIDKYRDDVERAYEMDKLRSKYTDLLNQAQGASLQTQNKIRAQMQEQLDLLDGQKTVSEYDVKLANAKLEILQKQIALEDAQRNKNQMKLRRDTQGNYRYVYTANQNDVSGAQQDLLDSEYDAYELSKNQQMTNYDNLINAYQKYLSQREEILNNANLSEQEKLNQNAELYKKFMEFVDAAKEDFSDAAFGTLDILNWLTLNGTDYTTTAAKDMLNELLDEQGNIKDKTGVIWMDNATYLTEEVIPKISEAVDEADDDIEQRLIDLRENMVGSNGVIPEIVSGIEGEDGLTTALDEARTATDGLVVSTKDLMEALNGDNSSLVEAQEKLQKYREELEQVKNASSIVAQQLKDTQKDLDKSEAEKLNYKTQLDDLTSGKKVVKNGKIVDPNAEKKKSKSTSGGSSKKNGELTGFTGVYHADSWGGGDWGDWYAGQKDAVRISSFSRESGYGPYNVHLETKSGGWLGWVKESQLFDTGGYTGKWTDGDKKDNGRLAFLHQKELVLNSEDTKNILAAVDIVRQIGTGLRNSVSNMNLPFGKALSTIGDTIEQRVEITASFPNATDADDIRQALIGLSDKAYQYAHRTI